MVDDGVVMPTIVVVVINIAVLLIAVTLKAFESHNLRASYDLVDTWDSQ